MKHLPLRSKKYEQYTLDFGEYLRTVGYSLSSASSLPSMMREFFHFCEKHKAGRIEAIGQSIGLQFIQHLQSRKNTRRDGGLGASNINNHIRSIRLFREYLKSSRGIELPLSLQRMEDVKPTGQAILTTEEIKQLYGACDETPYGMRDKAMLAVYYGCGLRKGEGINLDISDILFDRKLLYIRKAKNNYERYVPISSGSLRDIAQYLYNARELLLSQGSKEAALFISERGSRLDKGMMYLRFKALAQKAHIAKEAGLHTLRHSIATHLLEKGMELENIALFLGHRCLDSTQVYTHILNEQL